MTPKSNRLSLGAAWGRGLNESNPEAGAPIPELRLSLAFYAPGAVLEAHCHETGFVGIVLGGAVEEQAGGRQASGRIGAMTVKPAGTVHRNRFGAAGAILLSIGDAPRRPLDRLGWMWREQSGQAPAGLAAALALRDGDPFGAAQEAAWQILASAGDEGRPGRASPAAPWLSRVRDRVAATRGRPSIGALARSEGVHPVYLTRLFHLSYGCSISRFIRRLRVQRGADLLARTDLQVSAIAADLDFADQSHFCRTFRAEMGVSPSAYRSVVRPNARRSSTGPGQVRN